MQFGQLRQGPDQRREVRIQFPVIGRRNEQFQASKTRERLNVRNIDRGVDTIRESEFGKRRALRDVLKHTVNGSDNENRVNSAL